MAKTNLYQVYDRQAEQVLGPIINHNRDGAAIRQFHELLADEKTDPGLHPEDFDLLHLGTQDRDTGLITGMTPTTIATGADWKAMRTASARSGAATLRGPDIHYSPEIDG